MAIYTCYACGEISTKRLTFTYMSWYKGNDLVRYRMAFCDSCTLVERDTAITNGYKRLDDGSWIGPQAILPGVAAPGVPQNGTLAGVQAVPPSKRIS